MQLYFYVTRVPFAAIRCVFSILAGVSSARRPPKWPAARLRGGFRPALPGNDSRALFHEDQLVSGDAFQLFVLPAGPTNGDVRHLFRAQSKMQSGIVYGIEARLAQHLLCL